MIDCAETGSRKFENGEKYSVEIPVAGHTPLHGELYRVSASSPPKLLWLPAMGVPASYYEPFARSLGEVGIECLVLDLRGQGNSSPPSSRKSKYGYRHLFDVDIPAALAQLKALTGPGPLLSGGHSLGGQAALLHAASDAKQLSGLVFVAAQLPYYAAYPIKDRLRMWLGSQTVKTVASIWGYWPGHRLGFGGRQPLPMVRDWSRVVRTGNWANIAGGFDEHLLEDLSLPTLALSIDGDRDAPFSTVERFIDPLKGANVSHIHHIPSELSASDHLRWARRGAKPIAMKIANWASDVRVPH